MGSANQKEPVASAANTSDDAEERHSKVNPNMPPPILVRESMPPVKMLTRTIAALGHRAGCVDDAKREAAAAFIIRPVLTLTIPGVPTTVIVAASPLQTSPFSSEVGPYQPEI